jgi:general L-amino acid transport system permease protein
MPTRRSTLARWFFDARLRSYAAQAALVAVLAWLIWSAVANAVTNLAKQGVATGFGFLNTVSGFDISMKLVVYGPGSTYGRALLVAVLNTLLVSAIGILLATAVGFALGIARLARNWLLSRLAGTYIEFARNIPLLLFVFIWYYGVLTALPPPRTGFAVFGAVFLNNRGLALPAAQDGSPFWAVPIALAVGIGTLAALRAYRRRHPERFGAATPLTVTLGLAVGLPLLAAAGAALAVRWDVPRLQGFNVRGGVALNPEFVALCLALATYTSAFIAEIVRAGILAVGEGQRDAAKALGLPPGLTLRLVVIPQALRAILPPLANQYLNLIKNSSFGAAIAFPEIVQVFVGTALNQTGQAVEIIGLTLAIYLAINLAVSALMNWYNHRMRLVTR